MPRSEKAKELEAKQKAQVAAEKERKKNSTDPRDWSQWRQLRETYKLTAEQDPKLPMIMGGSILAGVVLGVLIGLFLKPMWPWVIMGLFLGAALAMWLFTRRVKTAMFKRFEGQAGSAEVALGMLGKEWNSSPAINATRQMDVIHRAIGPGGLILVTEGNSSQLKQLLATEVRRHEQTAYGVTVQTISMGDGEGQVPLSKLADHIKKLPKQLSAAQVEDVTRRVRAMDAVRSRMPIPKGPINTRGSRQAMRGR